MAILTLRIIQSEEEELNKIIEETLGMGLQLISDSDARPQGGAHPVGHLLGQWE